MNAQVAAVVVRSPAVVLANNIILVVFYRDYSQYDW